MIKYDTIILLVHKGAYKLFKSSFSKYLIAFILIIVVSFLMLSGIITSVIRGYMTEQTEEKLELSTDLVVDYLESLGVEDMKSQMWTPQFSMVISPIVNFDNQIDVIVADSGGEVILSTAVPSAIGEDGHKTPVIWGDDYLGEIRISDFDQSVNEEGEKYLIHRGTLGGMLAENSIVCADEVVTGGERRGYVLMLASTVKEDKLVSKTREALISSSVWVMIAAVIATYFITERIIHPLRTMTNAAKRFGKGDFTARVTVAGKDEISELGNAFNNMAESLDSLEKMRNSFLANVSHDLRTPMTTISGFIDGITSGAIPPEKHEYYLGVISAEVHRLSRLVTQLLDVSRLESGERKFNFTDFDIAEVARIILISFEQKIEDKHLDVEFYSEHDEMTVNADKDAIYQVLYNLCHNAIKFAKEGGKLRISVSYAANKKIRVAVFDEGQSIDGEEKKMIFDRFYKTDKSRGLDKSGVGLGLYISKTIIEAHDEKIWVESVSGESSEFIFTLKEGSPLQKRK